jgi:hypothetical protein
MWTRRPTTICGAFVTAADVPIQNILIRAEDPDGNVPAVRRTVRVATFDGVEPGDMTIRQSGRGKGRGSKAKGDGVTTIKHGAPPGTAAVMTYDGMGGGPCHRMLRKARFWKGP